MLQMNGQPQKEKTINHRWKLSLVHQLMLQKSDASPQQNVGSNYKLWYQQQNGSKFKERSVKRIVGNYEINNTKRPVEPYYSY